MHEYRITRPQLYPPGSLGHEDPSARQGYYIRADDFSSVRKIWNQQYPGLAGETIEIQEWR